MRHLKGSDYTSDVEVKAAIKSWIRERSEELFIDMKKLVEHFEKCIILNSDYVQELKYDFEP